MTQCTNIVLVGKFLTGVICRLVEMVFAGDPASMACDNIQHHIVLYFVFSSMERNSVFLIGLNIEDEN